MTSLSLFRLASNDREGHRNVRTREGGHVREAELVRQDEEELVRVRALVLRFLRQRTEDDPDDLAQETVARLLANRDRLSREVWAAYAMTTARNLLVERERHRQRERRSRHRLHSGASAEPADEPILQHEQHLAVLRALGDLPPADQVLLREHYVDRGEGGGTVSGAFAARLARARAHLRVAYLIEYARLELPTPRCRPVLQALSAGDRRRQIRLGAARHLLACQTCAAHSEALVGRSRGGLGVSVLSWLGLAAAVGWSAVRRRPLRATAVGTVAALAASALIIVGVQDRNGQPAPPSGPQPAAAGTVTVGSMQVLPGSPSPPLPVGTAVGRDVRVSSVPADEGFWVGAGPGQRVWIQLAGQSESPVVVRAGDTVSFAGTTMRPDEQFLACAGITDAEGAGELLRQNWYIQVLRDDVTVRKHRQ
jgi:RNA polymerase sigma factor (sigma-70 family)